MKSSDSTVFVVDDDTSLLGAFRRLLASVGYNVETSASPEEFLNRYEPTLSGCLLLDVHMPGMTGFDLHQALAAFGCKLGVIFVSGDHAAISRGARRARAVAYLHKPVDENHLLDAVRRAIAGGP